MLLNSKPLLPRADDRRATWERRHPSRRVREMAMIRGSNGTDIHSPAGVPALPGLEVTARWRYALLPLIFVLTTCDLGGAEARGTEEKYFRSDGGIARAPGSLPD